MGEEGAASVLLGQADLGGRCEQTKTSSSASKQAELDGTVCLGVTWGVAGVKKVVYTFVAMGYEFPGNGPGRSDPTDAELARVKQRL